MAVGEERPIFEIRSLGSWSRSDCLRNALNPAKGPRKNANLRYNHRTYADDLGGWGVCAGYARTNTPISPELRHS
jgi:hypothetical protein